MGGEKCVLLSYKGKEREGEDPELNEEKALHRMTRERDENMRTMGAKAVGVIREVQRFLPILS